jgi:tetrahydromethanopterin S-methyltransferase subunit C
MVCRTARNCTIFLNALFILIGISLAATGGYMLNVVSKYDIPGAPAKMAMYILISLGVFLTLLACLGMQGSAMRKTEGSEGRGLCLLIVYAVLLFLILLVEIIMGIVIFVWVGGSLGPLSKKIESNQRAQKSVEKGAKQANNFINCVYDGCCSAQKVDPELFAPVGCYTSSKGVPNSEGTLTTHKCPGDEYPCDPPASVAQVCSSIDDSVLNTEACNAGIETFRTNVAYWLSENIKPIAYVCMGVGGLQFILFIFAVLQICWCCGKSDPVEDWDSEDDEYYDEYGRIVY